MCFSWSEDRQIFNEEATKIRAEFNQNIKAPPEQGKRLLREAKERMAELTHPDPYINPHTPGGTSFMRNPAIPLKVVYPNGIPAWESKRRMNIDMSYVPEDQEFADKTFVDSISKQYWIEK